MDFLMRGACSSLPRPAYRLAAMALFSMAVGNVAAADLHISVQAFKDGSGHALLRLFAAPDGFPKEPGKALRSVKVNIDAGQASATFGSLAPGDYAVAVAHDANDSGELDFGMLGIPKEGYGFSRDAKATLGPPSFEQAKIRLGSEQLNEVIHMRY